MTDVPVITVDGPSGAGKGTLCQLLARKVGFHLLDSGALYRLTALAVVNQGLDLSDADLCAEVARSLDVVFDVSGDTTRVKLEGSDVTTEIRKEVVGHGASVVAAHSPVRAALLDRQKAFASLPGLIADGRDMGTVVFPNAILKVFLTASSEERARRRVEQLKQAGENANYSSVLADIRARDERDAGRSVAPLKAAGDAFVIDSTDLSIEAVLARVILLAEQKYIPLAKNKT